MWDLVDALGAIIGLLGMVWVYWRGYGALFDLRRGDSRARGREMMRIGARAGLVTAALFLLLLLQRFVTAK
jgi:hypothetical protein